MRIFLLLGITAGVIGCVQLGDSNYVHATTAVMPTEIAEQVEVCLKVKIVVNGVIHAERECQIFDISKEIPQLDVHWRK